MPELTPHSIASSHPLPPSLYAAPPADPPAAPVEPPPVVVAPPSDPADPPEPPATWDPRDPKAAPFPWEQHPAFRFTFLLWFTRPGDRELLEALGRLLYDMALEVCGTWPPFRESTTRAEMRAAAQDLRHLEAFLLSVYREQETASLQGEDERLSIMAGTWSSMVGRIASGIESAVWPVQGTDGSFYP